MTSTPQAEYTLLRFDDIVGLATGQIPPGSAIVSATLRYTVFNTGNPASVREALTDWTESSTYSSFCGAGCNPGVQFGSAAVASATAAASSDVTIDVTASVQGWVSGGTNRGWFFLPTGIDGVDVRSSENATAAQRPLLTVQYIAAPNCSTDDDCDDDDACNGQETCAGSYCVASTPVACDDGNVCNGTESCDPVGGSCGAGSSASAGTPCSDGDACWTIKSSWPISIISWTEGCSRKRSTAIWTASGDFIITSSRRSRCRW